jgi:L-lactate dehydrogenase complex protein LldG
MTGDERAAMRHRLRAAVGRALLPDAPLEHPGPIRLPPEAPGHRLERFQAQLTALGGAVHEAATPEAIANLIASLAASETARQAAGSKDQGGGAAATSRPSFLMWHEETLPVPGLAGYLADLGLRCVPQLDVDGSSTDRRAELAGAVVGLTGADAGLAETGSLVLVSGPGRGRLVSLLPPIHVALLDRRLVVESLADLMVERPALLTGGANVVCITGPSRTADIEHTLTRGVHGPREVHVVLVDGVSPDGR